MATVCISYLELLNLVMVICVRLKPLAAIDLHVHIKSSRTKNNQLATIEFGIESESVYNWQCTVFDDRLK